MNGLIEVSTKGTYTNLLQLFTGTAYIAIPEIEWRGDPFQDAVPCFLATDTNGLIENHYRNNPDAVLAVTDGAYASWEALCTGKRG